MFALSSDSSDCLTLNSLYIFKCVFTQKLLANGLQKRGSKGVMIYKEHRDLHSGECCYLSGLGKTW